MSCQADLIENDCINPIVQGDISVRLIHNLKIDMPVDHFPGAKVTYQINRSNKSLLVSTSTDKFYTIDLTNGSLGPISTLGLSKIKGFGIADYVNNDTIVITTEYPPAAFLMNSNGEVYQHYDLKNAPTSDWMGSYSKGLYNLETYYEQGRPTLKNNKLYILLASEFYYYKEKNKVEFFGVFDIVNKKWLQVFSNVPDYYLQKKIETPDTHLYPYMTINGNKLLVSYPLSHRIQIFKLTDNGTELELEVCAKSKFFNEFPQAYRLHSEDSQKGIDFYISSPSYAAFNYHSDAQVYSRVVRHGLAINDPTQQPDLCKTNYSIQFFNQEMEFINEVFLEQPKNLWIYPIPTKSGFIVRKRCSDYSDDSIEFDFFNIEKP
jgi:hypothetical protein